MLDAALIFFSLIGFILCLLPLPVHWRARNTGTLLIILWSSLGCLFVFLNCVVWANSYKDRAPVLCDITVKVQSAYYTGITAASLCVTRRLASIAGARSRIISQRRKRIDLAIDLSLGLGLPIIVMIGSYVVQPHRYDIDEAFGCASSVWMSVPAICLLYLWPVVLSAASSVYGVMAITHLLARRHQFNTLLRQSQSGLDTSQYLRLLALASADIVLSLPLTIYSLVRAAQAARPWPGWSTVHEDWSQVLVHSAAVMNRDNEGLIARMMSKYLCPVLAIIFFLFFGVSDDALNEYTKWARKVAKSIGLQRQPNHHVQSTPNRWPTLGSTVNRLDNSVPKDDSPMTAKSPTSPYTMKGMAINVDVQRQVV